MCNNRVCWANAENSIYTKGRTQCELMLGKNKCIMYVKLLKYGTCPFFNAVCYIYCMIWIDCFPYSICCAIFFCIYVNLKKKFLRRRIVQSLMIDYINSYCNTKLFVHYIKASNKPNFWNAVKFKWNSSMDPEICSSFKNCISMQTNANNSYRVVFPVVALQPIRETLLLDWAKHRFEFSRHFPTLTLLKANSQRRPNTTSKPNATC